MDRVEYPSVYLDATCLKNVRDNLCQPASTATAAGNREVLDCDVGDSKSEGSWQQSLGSSRDRGLRGARPVVSDARRGPAAADRWPRGAARQRCPVHLIGNLLAMVPKSHQHTAAAPFRTIFAQPAATAAAWDQARGQPAGRFAKTGPLMDTAKADVPAFASFPRPHWQNTWPTNPLGRTNKEIKRPSRVVGIFPDEASAVRLVGATGADLHDEPQATHRRYLSEDPVSPLQPQRDTTAPAEPIIGS